ncbi:transporter [Aquimarina sp. ERC-38]|uniref:transporter n=1 Tax=Aquimarina sp. ERC-38 TaxID=2949996 RepID=UPI0022485578|nr:transporter [Aquimarina sp. ERC-38]UZO79317.1 transporter [Aquimarina sp. ERC-38]
MNFLFRIVVFSCLLIFPLGTFGQEVNTLGVLITDRPDATESPTVIPIGYLQIETGAFYEENEDDILKIENITYNTTLLRYGLLKNLELRLGWNVSKTTSTVNIEELEGSNITEQIGFTPFLTGVKIAIAEEKNGWPEIGFLGHLYLPFTASADYKPETTGADFRFSFAHTLSKKSALAYNLGAAWGDDSPEVAYQYTLSYGYSLTDTLGMYAEIYGDFPENSKANHLWDAGITYLLTEGIQLDATVGSGITEGQNILLSAGASIRLPK